MDSCRQEKIDFQPEYFDVLLIVRQNSERDGRHGNDITKIFYFSVHLSLLGNDPELGRN